MCACACVCNFVSLDSIRRPSSNVGQPLLFTHGHQLIGEGLFQRDEREVLLCDGSLSKSRKGGMKIVLSFKGGL